MEDVLRDKIVFILLILASIDFIYTGCCKKRGNDGGNKSSGKTNSAGNPGNPVGRPEENLANTKKDGLAHGDGKKSGGGDKGKTSGKGKLGYLTSKSVGAKNWIGWQKKLPKVDEETMKKVIIEAISKYINDTDGTNRSGVKIMMYCGYDVCYKCFFINWNSCCYFNITYSSIDELYSLVQKGKFGDIKVTVKEVRYSPDSPQFSGVNYIFDDSHGFDLKGLCESLNSLPSIYRPVRNDSDGCDEYLCVRDINNTNIRNMNIYINLRNGVLYSIEAMGGLYRVKINDDGSVVNDSTCSFDGRFSGIGNGAKEVFNENLLKKEDIKRFKFVLAK